MLLCLLIARKSKFVALLGAEKCWNTGSWFGHQEELGSVFTVSKSKPHLGGLRFPSESLLFDDNREFLSLDHRGMFGQLPLYYGHVLSFFSYSCVQ